MSTERVFSTMPPECAKFYHRVFNEVLLNLHAVRHGYFDVLLCETDSAQVVHRWKQDAPRIVELMLREQGRI